MRFGGTLSSLLMFQQVKNYSTEVWVLNLCSTSHPLGLFNVPNVGVFFADIASENSSMTEEKWGISNDQVESLNIGELI